VCALDRNDQPEDVGDAFGLDAPQTNGELVRVTEFAFHTILSESPPKFRERAVATSSLQSSNECSFSHTRLLKEFTSVVTPFTHSGAAKDMKEQIGRASWRERV
jgi:hypothetical protein